MKHKKTILIAAGIVVLGVATFILFRNKKKVYGNLILKKGASFQPLAWLITLDEGYLKSWSAAAEAGQSTFVYGGKSYNTQGGKSVPVASGSSASSDTADASAGPTTAEDALFAMINGQISKG